MWVYICVCVFVCYACNNNTMRVVVVSMQIEITVQILYTNSSFPNAIELSFSLSHVRLKLCARAMLCCI